MGVRKDIHLKVTATIQATNTQQWVDMWKNQINRQREAYPFNFPASFVSIRRIPWQDMQLNVKEGPMTLEVYVFFNKWRDTFEGAADQANSLDIIDVVETLANDLHFLEDDAIINDFTQVDEEDISIAYGRPGYRLVFTAHVRKQITPVPYVSN
ncbi:MAG: hypothetical protein AAF717_00290 [Bacteroidota bacterium]